MAYFQPGLVTVRWRYWIAATIFHPDPGNVPEDEDSGMPSFASWRSVRD
jgi:hypothetical protein